MVAPTENAFHAVTDAEGHFAIRGAPIGRYTLEAWDADLGTRTAEIALPTSTLVRFSFGAGTAVADPRGPCKIALKGDGPVARACAQGGRAAAVKLMNDLVKRAEALRRRVTCDGCHRDVDNYELTPNARNDLDGLLAAVASPPALR